MAGSTTGGMPVMVAGATARVDGLALVVAAAAVAAMVDRSAGRDVVSVDEVVEVVEELGGDVDVEARDAARPDEQPATRATARRARPARIWRGRTGMAGEATGRRGRRPGGHSGGTAPV